MRKIIILVFSFLSFTQTKAQKELIKLNGHWTKQNTNWDAQFHAELYVNSKDSIYGIINWAYLKVDEESKSYYDQYIIIQEDDGKNIYLSRKEGKASEYITGYYDRKINTLYFKGIAETDPAGIISIDEYKIDLKLSNEFTGAALGYEKNWSGILNGTFIKTSVFAGVNSEVLEKVEDLEKYCVIFLPFDGNYKDVSKTQQPTQLGSYLKTNEKYSEGIFGIPNTAFYFDNSSYGKGLSLMDWNGRNPINVFDLTKLKKFSISFLFKPNMTKQHGKLFGTYGNSKENLFTIDINESNKIEIHVDNKALIISKSEIIPNQYHHLFLNNDGKFITLYCDGKLEGKTEFKIPKIELGTFSSSSEDKVEYRIGSTNWKRNNYSTYMGSIDEFKIFSIAATEQYISKLYSTYFPSFTKAYLSKKYKISTEIEGDILQAIIQSGNRQELVNAMELFYPAIINTTAKINAGKYLLSTSKSLAEIYKISLLIPEIKSEASDLALLRINSIDDFRAYIKLFPYNTKVKVDKSSYYYGEVDKRNYKQGKGYYIDENTTYDGYWEDNMYSGKGYLTTQDLILSGDFRKGKLHGKGIYYSLISEERYEGEFENGIYNGICTKWTSEDLTYSGQVSNGRFHGQGKYEKSDGSWYEGNFKNGVENGMGTLRLRNGLRYTGNFTNGYPNGTFKIQRWTLAGLAKDTWTAEFKDGKLISSSQTETGMTDFLNSKPTPSSSSSSEKENNSTNSEKVKNSAKETKEAATVEKIKYEKTDWYFVYGESDKYYVTYSDGTTGNLFYSKKYSKWYISNGLEDFAYDSKDNALSALYEYKVNGTIRKIGLKK